MNKLEVDGKHTITRNTAATRLVNNKFRSISLQVHTWTYIRIKKKTRQEFMLNCLQNLVPYTKHIYYYLTMKHVLNT